MDKHTPGPWKIDRDFTQYEFNQYYSINSLDGYYKGDGSKTTTGKTLTTIKEDVAYGVQMMFAKLGKVAKVYKIITDTNFKKNHIYFV